MSDADVVIVGAGPIGLELAVCLKLMQVDYVHLEAGQIGQTITWFPKQVRFFSSPERIAIAGVPLHTPDQSKATREEYLAYLRGIVDQFDLPIHTYERVVDIKRNTSANDGLVLTTQHRDEHCTYHAKRVVLAIGDLHRPRKLNIPGEDLEHVSHYFDEPHKYFRQNLLIVGGRNSAVEAAIRCHRAGAQVTMSYRDNEFPESVKYWLRPEIEVLIKRNLITFHPHTRSTGITPTHVTLASNHDGKTIDVPADFVLLMTGYEMDPTLFNQVGVTLGGENDAPMFNPDTMETNVPGLYVAGTASAGTQKHFKLFIENCHPHVTRIVRAITGKPPPTGRVNPVADRFALPES